MISLRYITDIILISVWRCISDLTAGGESQGQLGLHESAEEETGGDSGQQEQADGEEESQESQDELIECGKCDKFLPSAYQGETDRAFRGLT